MKKKAKIKKTKNKNKNHNGNGKKNAHGKLQIEIYEPTTNRGSNTGAT